MTRKISSSVPVSAASAAAGRLDTVAEKLNALGISDVRFSFGGMRQNTRDQIYLAVADVLEAVLDSEGSTTPEPVGDVGYGLKP